MKVIKLLDMWLIMCNRKLDGLLMKLYELIMRKVRCTVILLLRTELMCNYVCLKRLRLTLIRCTSLLVVLNLMNVGKLRTCLCTRRLLRTSWITRMPDALLTR